MSFGFITSYIVLKSCVILVLSVFKTSNHDHMLSSLVLAYEKHYMTTYPLGYKASLARFAVVHNAIVMIQESLQVFIMDRHTDLFFF